MRPNPEVTAQRVGGMIMLVHTRSNDIYELNHTAARVWELLHTELSLEELQKQLLSEFEVSAEVLEREITGILRFFEDQGLLIACGQA